MKFDEDILRNGFLEPNLGLRHLFLFPFYKGHIDEYGEMVSISVLKIYLCHILVINCSFCDSLFH